MAAGVWESAKEAIVAYTGLSPALFFTVLALAVAFYYAISGLFGQPENVVVHQREVDEVDPLPPPIQLGEVTEEELKAYDGSDPKKPLLMAIKGQIYDVTQSRMFYGPGGPYALFAGKDASRALAKMSFEPKDLTGDISGLGPFELEALQDWEYKFMSKYVKVGTVKETEHIIAEGSTDNSSFETAEPSTSAPSTDNRFDKTVVGSENITEAAEALGVLIQKEPESTNLHGDDVHEHEHNHAEEVADDGSVQENGESKPIGHTEKSMEEYEIGAEEHRV